MLGYWRSHSDYQNFVVSTFSETSRFYMPSLFEYEDVISKLYIANLDKLQDLLSPLYSNTGRPAEVQSEIFRSLILMNHLKCPLNNWSQKLKSNFVLRTVAGFTLDNIPETTSYYDFFNRIFKLDERPRLKSVKRKPSKTIGGDKKLVPKKSGSVLNLKEQIISGRRFNNRPELLLQKIFAEVCVNQSVELGLIPQVVSISGDGTCVETGASSRGVKVCECKKQGIYNCDCSRKFSDPNARWGWDSHKEHWFYGYTGYFISTYNRSSKTDLPLYLRLVDANRHDSVSAVVALAEFRDLYPNLTVDTFISDCASDNYPTYDLLDYWSINAVIALNSKNKGKNIYPTYISIDENGVPICPAGHKMINYGFSHKDRCRIKWRCPKALGKADATDACDNCSKSPYGRVIHTKPSWDTRLFTKIPRGSIQWKDKMKERTAAERVNNRILNDYGIEASKTRGKKRISIFTTLAGFNIHLDAQLKVLKSKGLFDFNQIFAIQKAS